MFANEAVLFANQVQVSRFNFIEKIVQSETETSIGILTLEVGKQERFLLPHTFTSILLSLLWPLRIHQYNLYNSS